MSCKCSSCKHLTCTNRLVLKAVQDSEQLPQDIADLLENMSDLASDAEKLKKYKEKGQLQLKKTKIWLVNSTQLVYDICGFAQTYIRKSTLGKYDFQQRIN